MGKLTIYLGKDEEAKILAIKKALKNEIPKALKNEIPDITLDFSKSRIVRMAINRLYTRFYPEKPKKKES